MSRPSQRQIAHARRLREAERAAGSDSLELASDLWELQSIYPGPVAISDQDHRDIRRWTHNHFEDRKP